MMNLSKAVPLARTLRLDRSIQGVLVGSLMAMSPAAGAPLARFGSPFALLIALPALALSLEAFGWSECVASVLRRLSHPLPRLLGAYALWLGTSAVLTLDVAAAAGPGVAVEIAGQKAAQRRWHLGAAMLGSNVGSLLFPFSNLTNLVLVGAAGIGLAFLHRDGVAAAARRGVRRGHRSRVARAAIRRTRR